MRMRETSDRPAGDELLELARETLLQELLPALPREAHYTARMIANAIVIARREHAAEDPAAELRALGVVVGAAANQGADAGRALGMAIRAGVFDTDAALRAQLFEALTRWTRARLAISNPRVLHTS
jgi:hypothetical protein